MVSQVCVQTVSVFDVGKESETSEQMFITLKCNKCLYVLSLSQGHQHHISSRIIRQ